MFVSKKALQKLFLLLLDNCGNSAMRSCVDCRDYSVIQLPSPLAYESWFFSEIEILNED